MIQFTLEDDDGNEVEHELPSKKGVCPSCDGHGTHLTEGMRGHAYTAEEFAESFDDEDREEYFRRGGKYDVTCTECGGSNVVDVIDDEKIKLDPALVELEKQYWKKLQREAEYASEDRYTRRMECGGYD